MDILGDMQLFVKVVHCGGLAAAGRELGLSPASMTTRLKGLENRYQVKLLTRTTRSIALTDEGREFYDDCLNILADVKEAENKLKIGREALSGPLRITATSDLGQQHVAAVIADFVKSHPNISPYLFLNDSITNLTENNLDLAIRYGESREGSLVAKKLATNKRVLVASPAYLEKHGRPSHIKELSEHKTLAMVQTRVTLSTWYFQTKQGEQSIQITPSRSSNDGSLVHRWATEGYGITLKSIWDVVEDIKNNKLITLFDDYKPDYQSKGTSRGMDLHVVYPSREYLPQRTRSFIDALTKYFSEKSLQYSL